MEYALIEITCPPMPPSSYLEWASWWHRVEQRLTDDATSAGDPDLAVRQRATFWDRLLEEISKDASRAMLRREPTIEPSVRCPRQDALEAAQIARARLAWVRGTGDAVLRPSAAVSRTMGKLSSTADERAGTRPAFTAI